MIFKNPTEAIGCDISVEHIGDAANPWFGFVLTEHRATGLGAARAIVGQAHYVPASEEWREIVFRVTGAFPSGIEAMVYDGLAGLWESMPSVADPRAGSIAIVTIRDIYMVMGPVAAGKARWYGYITDATTGESIAGVDVRAYNPEHPTIAWHSGETDKQGAFLCTGAQLPGDLPFRLWQDRTYEPISGTVHLVVGNNLTRFTMERILPPTVEEWRRLEIAPGVRR